MGLIWMVLSGVVQGAQRGGVALVGGVGVQVAAPDFTTGDPSPLALGCGGVDISLLPPDQKRRNGRKGYRPNNQRLVAALLACSSAEETTYAGFGIGPGAQWGGRSFYTTAHMVGGVGLYEHRSGGRSYEEIGFWLRPRFAVGAQLGPSFAVEVGPTAHVIIPVLTRHEGAPPVGEFEGILGVDLTLVAGSVAPKRWRR